MHWNQVIGSWRQFQGRATEKTGVLTNDVLYRILGKHEPVIDKLSEPRGSGKLEEEPEKKFVRVNSS